MEVEIMAGRGRRGKKEYDGGGWKVNVVGVFALQRLRSSAPVYCSCNTPTHMP